MEKLYRETDNPNDADCEAIEIFLSTGYPAVNNPCTHKAWLEELPPIEDVEGVSEVNWEKLRNDFFNDCTEIDNRYGNNIRKLGAIRRINMAPHDLFEWMQSKLNERK